MSFSFYISAPNPPDISDVLVALAEPTLVWKGPKEGNFPNEFFFHPYLPGRSARGVELGLEDGSLQVRIMNCSSRADFELGLRIARVLARMTGSKICPEVGGEFSASALKSEYGEEWIDFMVDAGPSAVLSMVDARNGVLALDGPRRTFFIGTRFAKELRAAGEGDVGQRLLDAMVRVQNIDEDEYFVAARYRAQGEPDSALASGYTWSAWGPGGTYLFGDVEYFSLCAPPSRESFLVPATAGPTIASDKWQYLDETNALVEATSDEDWPELMARAEPFVVLRET